jgi:hypothetical protein
MTSKAELIAELKGYGVDFNDKMSVPELLTIRQRYFQENPKVKSKAQKFQLKDDYMSSLQGLKRATLVTLMQLFGQTVMKRDTKGVLLLNIRELFPVLMKEPIKIGKFKGSKFLDVITDSPDCGFLEWILREINLSSHLDYQILKGLILVAYRGQALKYQEQNESGEEEQEEPRVERVTIKKELFQTEVKESGSPAKGTSHGKKPLLSPLSSFPTAPLHHFH